MAPAVRLQDSTPSTMPVARGGWVPAHVTCTVAPCVALVVLTTWLWLPFVTATPLSWARVNVLVLIGMCTLAAVAYAHAAISFSAREAAISGLLIFVVTWGAEAASLRWGDLVGFGYAYHAALQPRLPGGVPLFVPLAWCVLARVPLVLLRSMRITGAKHRVLAKTLCCALALAAWDLLLDPLAVSAGFWTWYSPGVYYGVPLLSLAFWFLVGLAVYLPYFLLHRLRDERVGARPAMSGALCAMVMLFVAPLLAVAVTARLHTIVPWIVWLACMAPWWFYWWRATMIAVTSSASLAPVSGSVVRARSTALLPSPSRRMSPAPSSVPATLHRGRPV
jgi:uncharacterized membrane protein